MRICTRNQILFGGVLKWSLSGPELVTTGSRTLTHGILKGPNLATLSFAWELITMKLPESFSLFQVKPSLYGEVSINLWLALSNG